MTDTKPSKSARKRKAQEMKALGEQLLGLADDELRRLDLDDRLVEALELARRLKSREALRRQKQFIAKLLMSIDVEPLLALTAEREASERKHALHFKSAERWRDRLVRERRSAVDEFETAVGRPLPEIASIVEALDQAFSDREVKHLRKTLFRQVFDALGDKGAAQVAEKANDR